MYLSFLSSNQVSNQEMFVNESVNIYPFFVFKGLDNGIQEPLVDDPILQRGGQPIAFLENDIKEGLHLVRPELCRYGQFMIIPCLPVGLPDTDLYGVAPLPILVEIIDQPAPAAIDLYPLAIFPAITEACDLKGNRRSLIQLR